MSHADPLPSRSGRLARPIALLLALLLVAGVLPVRATEAGTAGEAAVLAVLEAFLDALAGRDGETLRELLVPGAVLVAVGEGPDGTVMGRWSAERFIATVEQGDEPGLERIWEPEVRLDGAMATVRAEYDFHRGGELSHCGVDVFHLVRRDGHWRIVSVTYTVRPAVRCAPSPLGPPEEGAEEAAAGNQDAAPP